MYNLSKHAQIRCQQRGIDPVLIDILIILGAVIKEDNDSISLEIPKKSHKKIRKLLNLVSKNIYAVLSFDGEVITVAHKR